MLQHFCLIAPKYRERLDWHGTLSDMLFDGSAGCLVELFAKPQPPSQDEDDTPVIRPGRSGFFRLPREIYLFMLDLLEPGDALLFGLTCQYFWAMAKPRITRSFTEYLGRWAETPVVCIGSGTDPKTAYPSGLLEKEDIIEMEMGLQAEEFEEFEDLKLLGHFDWKKAGKPVDLYKLADARYESIQELRDNFNCSLLVTAFEAVHKYPVPKDMITVAAPSSSSFYPKNVEWILRNLTTREFVRPGPIALEPGLIHGPFIDPVGFGEVILMRTCWSTSGSVSIPNINNIHRGVWAGHMFDIVPLKTAKLDDSWVDISDEVAEEITQIWGGRDMQGQEGDPLSNRQKRWFNILYVGRRRP